jgi:hypothetical protein
MGIIKITDIVTWRFLMPALFIEDLFIDGFCCFFIAKYYVGGSIYSP